MSDETLKPCPFCGGEAQVMHMDLDSIEEGWKVWGVWCVDDLNAEDYRSHGHFIDNYATEAEAVAAWNARTRGTLTAEQVREVLLIHLPHREYYSIVQTDAWQAIADKLNAELGGGSCARCAEDMGRYADSLCDPLKERIAELLRCLENDWHIHASWDGLRKFWNIELTEEGVRMRDAMHGTLTADDIRGLIERHSDESGGNGRDFHNGAYVAIADELNARAERTCEEIVRCRDCAKADYAEVHMFDGTRPRKWTCTRFECFHHIVQPDDFCSRGERREP